MNSAQIGRIERVPLRDAWKHEAHNFTTWLEENLDLVGDTLGLHLAVIEREKTVGDFNVDLVAQEGEGNLVVIENQLERSDHDHLGKLITYSAMVAAKRAIWIVAEPRPEHLKAIQWLNEGGTAAFHLLKLEAVRIGDSLPAPLFTVITGPSEAIVQAGQVKRDQASSNNRYVHFWESLLSHARTKTQLHQSISPGTSSWVSARADMPKGFFLNYVLSWGRGRVELYIDEPQRGKEYTEALFHALEGHRTEIEEAFGGALEWQELPEGRACRVRKEIVARVNLSDDVTWPAFIDQMVDAMIRLNHAVRPFLQSAVSEAELAALIPPGTQDTATAEPMA